jgi:MFS family permease
MSSCTVVGTVIHFVPILGSFGATPMAAAAASSLVGVFSIAGRLATGLLLDRLPAHLVGVGTYLIPVTGAATLLVAGHKPFAQLLAASAFGLTLGAETDILIYLVTCHFGLRSFGSLMSAVFASIALGAALGPLAAGALFDMANNYTIYLLSTIVLALLSTIVLATLRCPPSPASQKVLET